MAKKKKKKPKRRSRAPVKKTKPKLPDAVLEQLHAQYEKVTQIQGIVSCARYASDSMLVPYRGQPDLVDGLQAAYNMLSDVAEILQELLPDGYGNIFDEE